MEVSNQTFICQSIVIRSDVPKTTSLPASTTSIPCSWSGIQGENSSNRLIRRTSQKPSILLDNQDKTPVHQSVGIFPHRSVGKESVCKAGDRVQFLGREDPLQKEMATHPGIFAWKILWREEPGGLQSMGFSRQAYQSGLPFPSTGDLPDPVSNPGFPHCRQIPYLLSYEGSP